MQTTPLFEDPTVYENGEVMRRLALGGALQIKRAAAGWSVEQAAVHAGLGHMTWRRMEDGYRVRNKTYAAVDGLLGIKSGTVMRALGDDLLMTAIAQEIADADTSDVTAATAAAWVERFAKQTLSSAAKSTVQARTTVPLHPARSETNGQMPLLTAVHDAVGRMNRTHPQSDLEAAAQLLDRLARRHLTPALEEAMHALFKAMPDLIQRQVEEDPDHDPDAHLDGHRVACG